MTILSVLLSIGWKLCVGAAIVGIIYLIGSKKHFEGIRRMRLPKIFRFSRSEYRGNNSEKETIVSLTKKNDDILQALCKTLNDHPEAVTKEAVREIITAFCTEQKLIWQNIQVNNHENTFAIMGYTPGNKPKHFDIIKDKNDNVWRIGKKLL